MADTVSLQYLSSGRPACAVSCWHVSGVCEFFRTGDIRRREARECCSGDLNGLGPTLSFLPSASPPRCCARNHRQASWLVRPSRNRRWRPFPHSSTAAPLSVTTDGARIFDQGAVQESCRSLELRRLGVGLTRKAGWASRGRCGMGVIRQLQSRNRGDLLFPSSKNLICSPETGP
jgi:hypothetical protein